MCYFCVFVLSYCINQNLGCMQAFLERHVNEMSMNKTFPVHNEVLSVILINRNVLRFTLELGAKIILLHHKICLELTMRIPFVTINPFFYQSRQLKFTVHVFPLT